MLRGQIAVLEDIQARTSLESEHEYLRLWDSLTTVKTAFLVEAVRLREQLTPALRLEPKSVLQRLVDEEQTSFQQALTSLATHRTLMLDSEITHGRRFLQRVLHAVTSLLLLNDGLVRPEHLLRSSSDDNILSRKSLGIQQHSPSLLHIFPSFILSMKTGVIYEHWGYPTAFT